VVDVRVGDRTVSSSDLVADFTLKNTRVRDITGAYDRGGLDADEDYHTVLPFDLPRPQDAIDYQKRNVTKRGESAGAFDKNRNSCLTHCALVVQAGGHAEFQGKTKEELTAMMKEKLGDKYPG
jgi:hypothetical protein